MKRGPKPFTHKTCPACGINKPRSEYFKKLDTVSYRCKPCTNANTRDRQAKYFGRYQERQNAWRNNRYATDPVYRDRIASQKAARYATTKDTINADRRERWLTDPDDPARRHNRNHDVKRRQPRWVDTRVIAQFYWDCPVGFEVDHIVPLRGVIDGRKVSGLHVIWNLQYLTIAENRRKHCRISERDITASTGS